MTVLNKCVTKEFYQGNVLTLCSSVLFRQVSKSKPDLLIPIILDKVIALADDILLIFDD